MNDVSDTCDASDKSGGSSFLYMLPVYLAWIGALVVAIFIFHYFDNASHVAKRPASSPVATSRIYSPTSQMDGVILNKVMMNHHRI